LTFFTAQHASIVDYSHHSIEKRTLKIGCHHNERSHKGMLFLALKSIELLGHWCQSVSFDVPVKSIIWERRIFQFFIVMAFYQKVLRFNYIFVTACVMIYSF